MYRRSELPEDKASPVVSRLTDLLVTADRFGLRTVSIATLEKLLEERGYFDPLGAAIKEKSLQLETGSFW